MNSDEFFEFYEDGRRDFKGEDLQNIDLFTPFIRSTHPEFFNNDLSKLIQENNPSIFKPVKGIDFNNASLTSANFLNSYLLKTNLSGANLTNTDARLAILSGSDFTNANLEGADLRYTNLSSTFFNGTNLKNAKLDHCNIKWANLENSEFQNTSIINSDFSHSTIKNCSLKESNFLKSIFDHVQILSSTIEYSNFNQASMRNLLIDDSLITESNFSYTTANKFNLKQSKLVNSNFDNSDLSDARFYYNEFINNSFRESNLSFTLLDNSEFKDSKFIGAKFNNSRLKLTLFKNVIFGETILSNINLNPFINSSIRHNGLSSIDYNSIYKTIIQNPAHPLDLDPYPKLRKFLELCGMPPIVAMYTIDSVRTLQPEQLVSLMRSTFISYGTPDEKFAQKLNSDLRDNGVTTFFFPMDATFGEKLHTTMRKVDNYDRIILICSKQSLDRTGLQFELEKTLEREARDGGESYLIPIALDKYLFEGWTPRRRELQQELLNRVVADFSDEGNYSNQFDRLLKALKKTDQEIAKMKINSV